MQYDLIIFVLIFIGADSSLSYFLTRSGHCSKEFTSTRGRVPLRLFSFYWYRGTANTNPSVPSNKRSNGQWPSCEGEVLRHLYAVSSSPLLALLHLQQLCWTFWSPLPLGGPMYWTGNWHRPCYRFHVTCFFHYDVLGSLQACFLVI